MNEQGAQSLKSDEGFTISSTSQTRDQLAAQFNKAPEDPGKADPEPDEPDDDPEAPEPAAGSPGAEQKAEEGKNKWSRKSASKRVEQALMESTRAKQRADEIEARANALQAELERLKAGSATKPEPPKQETKPAGDDGRPKQEDFDDWDKYQEALVDWKLEQRDKGAKQAQQRDLMVEHQVNVYKAWDERVKARVASGKDDKLTPEAFNLIPKGPIDLTGKLSNEQVLGWYIVSEESGLDLLKYLSDNPAELQRLSTLHQGRLLVELGRMDGRLSAAPLRDTAPAQTQISRATPPVRPVTAGAPSADDPLELPDAKLSDVEWAKKREAVEERRRKAGMSR